MVVYSRSRYFYLLIYMIINKNKKLLIGKCINQEWMDRFSSIFLPKEKSGKLKGFLYKRTQLHIM